MVNRKPDYEVLLWGSFQPAAFHARFDPLRRIEFTPDERSRIDRIWTEMVKSDSGIYNGPLVRLLSFVVNNDSLLLELGFTDFAEYIGTNEQLSENEEIVNEDKLANPLAVSVVTKTRDGKFVAEVRSDKVIFSTKGKFHVKPSGHLVSTNRSLLQKSMFPIYYPMLNAVQTEAHEELGVQPAEILAITCTGLIRTLDNRKPELTFSMSIAADSADILARPKSHSWESDRMLAIDYEPVRVRQFLLDNIEDFVPPGHAALLLAGRVDFGNDWYRSMVSSLWG